jgi:hypothetical protein
MMEKSSSSGVLIALTDCTDPQKEKEFNQWYNGVLIPSMKELGFIGKVSRYENVLSNSPTFLGVPKYLALWEIKHNDLKKAFEEILERDAQLKADGKSFNDMVRKVDTMYQQICPKILTERSNREVQGVYIVLNYNTDPAKEEEYNKWYNEKPYVVKQVVSPEGKVLKEFKPELIRQADVSQESINTTKQAMQAVCQPGGTSYYLFSHFPQDIKVAAKTGTAESGRVGDDPLKDYHGVFIAFAPVDDPQIAFAGVIEYGYHGGESTGNVAKAVFEQYFGIKDHLMENKE